MKKQITIGVGEAAITAKEIIDEKTGIEIKFGGYYDPMGFPFYFPSHMNFSTCILPSPYT